MKNEVYNSGLYPKHTPLCLAMYCGQGMLEDQDMPESMGKKRSV